MQPSSSGHPIRNGQHGSFIVFSCWSSHYGGFVFKVASSIPKKELQSPLHIGLCLHCDFTALFDIPETCINWKYAWHFWSHFLYLSICLSVFFLSFSLKLCLLGHHYFLARFAEFICVPLQPPKWWSVGASEFLSTCLLTMSYSFSCCFKGTTFFSNLKT